MQESLEPTKAPQAPSAFLAELRAATESSRVKLGPVYAGAAFSAGLDITNRLHSIVRTLLRDPRFRHAANLEASIRAGLQQRHITHAIMLAEPRKEYLAIFSETILVLAKAYDQCRAGTASKDVDDWWHGYELPHVAFSEPDKWFRKLELALDIVAVEYLSA